ACAHITESPDIQLDVPAECNYEGDLVALHFARNNRRLGTEVIPRVVVAIEMIVSDHSSASAGSKHVTSRTADRPRILTSFGALCFLQPTAGVSVLACHHH